MPRLTPRRGGVALAVLVLVSAVLRLAAARSIGAPFIAPDEMTYALLGRSLWSTGHMTILGADTPFYSLLYPAIAGVPLSIGELATGFSLLQGLQAVLVSLTAVPVYAWGRRFLTPGWALAAAALSLTPPALAYAGLVMSEAAFLPLLTLAAWALARAVETPTYARQGVLAAACAAALATRLQAVVLLPVIATAVLVDAGLARDRRRLRPWLPAAIAVTAVGLLAVLVAAATGSARSVLGAYGTTASTYEAGRAASFVAWHAADVFLLCAGIPLLALGALTVEALAGRLRGTAERALLATALALTLWLTVQVGVFASKYVGLLAERDLIGVLPVLFIAFALWLQLGAPRPRPWTPLLAVALAAPAILLPIGRFATLAAEPDSFMTIPFTDAAARWGAETLDTLWLVGAVAVLLAFLLVPGRLAPVLAGVVGVLLVAVSVKAGSTLAALSLDTQHRFFGRADPDWVDEHADGRVALFYDGGAYWPWVWHHVLWNRRVDAIVHVPDAPVPGVLPQRAVGPRFDGLLLDLSGRPVETPYVVAPTTMTFAGERVEQIAQENIDRAGLALWRVRPPARLATKTDGVLPNGDFTAAHVTVYGCRPGRLELTLLPKGGRPVTLAANGRVVDRVDIGGGEFWNGVISTPPDADGRTSCDFDVESDGLVGSTRLEYVPD
jgi:hypothetical protein